MGENEYYEMAAKGRQEQQEPKPYSTSSNNASKPECNKPDKYDDEMEKGELIKKSIKERLWRAEMEEGLDKEEFYVVSMVYFGHTVEGTYIPAELSVVKFNLKCGVIDQFHIHVSCEKLPLCVAHQAKEHALNTHGLPLPPYALGVANYYAISSNLLTFLQVKEEIPPLFTDAKQVSIVKNMLTTILGHHIKNKPLHISSVADLFFEMKQGAEMHMMSMTVFPSVKAAQEILDKDEFYDTRNICCEYHEALSLHDECALSKCMRWAYTISANCCLEMTIDLIPGRHVPFGFVDRPHLRHRYS